MKNSQATINVIFGVMFATCFLLAEAAVASPSSKNTTAKTHKTKRKQASTVNEPVSKPEKKLTKKDCDKLKTDGKLIPEACKILDMSIVFQGGIKTNKMREVSAVNQVKDSESDALNKRTIQFNKENTTPKKKSLALWEVARSEPPLFPEEPSNFLTTGLQLGYSFMVQRASGVEDAFNPVFHAGAEIGYQLFPMFQIALSGDFDYMTGSMVVSEEIIQNQVYKDDSPRHPRSVGADLDAYMGIGIRPTARMNINMQNFQLLVGVGLGWHFLHTSGQWRTKLPLDDRANKGELKGQAKWTGGDQAIYSFNVNDSGIYYVFDSALMYRIMENRLGVGVFFKYSVLIQGAIQPDVTVEKSYEVSDNNWEGYTAQENDYGDTFIRHLGSMSLMTVGVTADFRF